MSDAPDSLGRRQAEPELAPSAVPTEIQRLQRCISDLVSILALPAIWTGAKPLQIVNELAEALLPMLGLDALYIRLNEPLSSRLVHSPSVSALPSELIAILDQSQSDSFPSGPRLNRYAIGNGSIAVLALKLGVQDEIGLFVAGSQRETFPTEIERLLLRVAANQATVALHEAQLISRQQSMVTELDRRVAQRTTELAAAADELRNEMARKAAITDSALDCIVIVDHEGRIIEFNPAAEVTFGYTKVEVVGKTLVEVIVPPALRDAHRRGFERYLRTGESRVLGRRIEMTAMRADGHEFPTELTITRLPSGGPPVFTGFLRDITASKQSEEALAELRSQLAHAARVTTLGTLAASIAHEVNQPLSGIITNAGTCLRMLAAVPPDLDGARASATRIARDGHRAADVVKRLRALFSKEVVAEPLDLNEATEEVLALSSSELQRNAVTLRTELSDELPRIIGDRVQLQQVVLNLTLNAIEAMCAVEDRPRNLLVRTERDDSECVRLTVRDSGPGFTVDDADKLFDAFFTTKSAGMGVGLSVSRTIIESHSGRLWAVANEDHGATFAFSLPCRTN